MSEDKTQDISQRFDTKPTFETILEEMRDFRAGVEKRFDSFDTRMSRFEERIEARLDRIESEVKKTGSEFYEMRADFRELRNTLKEHFPAIK
jgi:predicted  nucleic acid-binding Zn-ribbon protein